MSVVFLNSNHQIIISASAIKNNKRPYIFQTEASAIFYCCEDKPERNSPTTTKSNPNGTESVVDENLKKSSF